MIVCFILRVAVDKGHFFKIRNFSKVAYHTHGGPDGLLFSDGARSLSELQNISSMINAREVGIASCFPSVQSSAWQSLNVSSVTYHDLSFLGNHSPYSDRGEGIKNIYNFIYGSH